MERLRTITFLRSLQIWGPSERLRLRDSELLDNEFREVDIPDSFGSHDLIETF